MALRLEAATPSTGPAVTLSNKIGRYEDTSHIDVVRHGRRDWFGAAWRIVSDGIDAATVFGNQQNPSQMC